MAIRSTLSLLAVAAILGGAAFYAVGLSNKPEDSAGAPEATEKRAVAETTPPAEEKQKLDGLSPAAGEEAKPKEEEKPAEEAKKPAEAADEEAKAPEAPAKSTKTPEEVLKSQDLQMTFGKPEAPVTVIEYFSLSCPHCGQFHKESQPKLIKDYVDTGKVFYIMRYFPHNGPGLGATVLMQCVDAAKKEEFLTALFNMQDKWAFTNDYKKHLMSIAQIGGMGPTDFEQCMADKSIEERVLAQRQEALDVLKLEGIPSIFVGGKPMEGSSYSRLVEMIEQELKSQ